MTFIDRIATEPPATLIAAEATAIKHMLDTRKPTAFVACGTWAKVNANKALHTRVLNDLRHVWTLANRNDPTWRAALATFINTHEETLTGGHGKLIRYRLIAEHAPERVNA